jgi:protein gp37
MVQKTSIEWTDRSANPIRARVIETGEILGWFCTHKDALCAHCYSERMNIWVGNGLAYIAQNEDKVEMVLMKEVLEEVINLAEPNKIFLCDMTDIFHRKVSFEQIDRVYAAMALAPQHTFQLLTKWPERMIEYYNSRENGFVDGGADAVREFTHLMYGEDGKMLPRLDQAGWYSDSWKDEEGLKESSLDYLGKLPLPNVWVGTSVGDKKGKERIDLIRQIPADVHYLSVEPLLEDLGEMNLEGIDQVIAGGESGPRARPTHPDWVRNVRDQCLRAGVPFFFKQWGECIHESQTDEDLWKDFVERGRVRDNVAKHIQYGGYTYRVGKKVAGRKLDGREWNEFPKP